MAIGKEIWISPSRPGYCVFGEAGYVSSKRPKMMRQWSEEALSDQPDVGFTEISGDNGRTWEQRRKVFSRRKEDGLIVLGGKEGGSPFVDEDNGLTLLFSGEVVLDSDDVLSGLKRRKIFYGISHDDGDSFGPVRQLVEKGPGFDAFHFMEGVYYGLNSASMAGKPIKISTDEILLPVYVAPIDEHGRLYNPLGGYTFTYGCFLIGTWKEDHSDLEWESTQLIEIDPRLSDRGLSEITVERMKDGRILTIGRGSNSYKWAATSQDNGRTWSEVEPLRFDDGGDLFSPSSYSLLIRHSGGKLLWIANIVPVHPQGNSPRYPLCIAEIDESQPSVRRQSVTVIDTRHEGEDEALQLSNFGVYEDRETHDIVVTCPRIFARGPKDWTAPCMKYTVPIAT